MSDLITPEWCREHDACYADEELVRVLGDGKTALEVLDLDIPVEHRIWAVSQWLPEREQRMFLADTLPRIFAREREAGREPDERSVAVLTALEAGRWPTREERAAAWAALAAEARAARAARAVAWAAEWVAAWVAVARAAWAAAWAEAAERESQIACLRRLVEEVQAKEPQCQS